MLRIPTLLLALALAAGCASLTEPGSDAERLAAGAELLSVDHAEYSPGDTIVVTLRNPLDQDLGHNLCLAARDFWTGSGWRRIEPLRMCAAVLLMLEPGETTRSEEYVTGEWEPGRYRIVTSVELMEDGERLEAVSAPFTVSR